MSIQSLAEQEVAERIVKDDLIARYQKMTIQMTGPIPCQLYPFYCTATGEDGRTLTKV